MKPPARDRTYQYAGAAAAFLGASPLGRFCFPLLIGAWPSHRDCGAEAGRLRRADEALHARAQTARRCLGRRLSRSAGLCPRLRPCRRGEAEPVRPASLFRIASVSKPFTAAAVMHLVEKGQLKLDDACFPFLKLQPHLERRRMDPRWHEITVRHCLQHTAGWNRDKSFDPMDCRDGRAGRQGAAGPPAHHAQANHPLHDGQAVGLRSGHGLRLFQLRLLRVGPGDRGRLRKALPRVRGRDRFSLRWAFAACGWARTS